MNEEIGKKKKRAEEMLRVGGVNERCMMGALRMIVGCGCMYLEEGAGEAQVGRYMLMSGVE